MLAHMTASTPDLALRENFYISAQHPALPGHFPGAPVVPGVVLLDRVVAALEREWKTPVSGFKQVKFLRPLLAEVRVDLIVERDSSGARFRILDGATVLASGIVEIAS
jgi:3-hydroxyacyl-[acyl-carrier-protein] dehydratase